MLLDWAAATHRGRFWLVGLGTTYVRGFIIGHIVSGLIVVAFADVLLISLEQPIGQAKNFKLTRCPRSARSDEGAASGVVITRGWTPPRLSPWESPFAEPTQLCRSIRW